MKYTVTDIVEALHVREICGFSCGFLLVNAFFVLIIFIGV